MKINYLLKKNFLRAIFGEKASDVKDTSLRVPTSTKGTVIGVEVFTRDEAEKDVRTISIEDDHVAEAKKDADDDEKIREKAFKIRAFISVLNGKVLTKIKDNKIKRGPKLDNTNLSDLSIDEILSIRVKDSDANDKIDELLQELKKAKSSIKKNFDEKVKKIRRGHDLAPGVIKIVKVYMAIKRRIQPGDKMAGRHGNKGVISEIMPIEDMPYDEQGNPVDIVLNPLGVPSRMNVGQVLETHMGCAAKGIGDLIDKMIKEQKNAAELKKFLEDLYNQKAHNKEDIHSLNNSEIQELAENLRNGVPIASPVFDGASEEEVKQMLANAKLPSSGQFTLFDGRTGRKFDRPITVVLYVYD